MSTCRIIAHFFCSQWTSRRYIRTNDPKNGSAVAFSAKHGGIFSEDITSPAVACCRTLWRSRLQDSRGHRWYGTLPGFGLFPHWGPGLFMTTLGFHGRKHMEYVRFDTTRFGLSILDRISGWWFGTMEFYDVPYIGNFIIPTDELIFFRGVGQPPTRFVWIRSASDSRKLSLRMARSLQLLA